MEKEGWAERSGAWETGPGVQGAGKGEDRETPNLPCSLVRWDPKRRPGGCLGSVVHKAGAQECM